MGSDIPEVSNHYIINKNRHQFHSIYPFRGIWPSDAFLYDYNSVSWASFIGKQIGQRSGWGKHRELLNNIVRYI